MVETVVTVERTTTTTGPPGGNPSAGDNGGFWSAIRINMDYYRTAPGIIKIVQFISQRLLSINAQFMPPGRHHV
ncbi:uncharacterized protein [Drosophila virilis]|uniref:uncharacterized protein isoform X2 n=1 Tax=Drosophila virilis TaxID=7244 RepID=UPI00139626A9|nr:uncharacterized protein LOC6634404 isoform X2 [Drosophila virilis]